MPRFSLYGLHVAESNYRGSPQRIGLCKENLLDKISGLKHEQFPAVIKVPLIPELRSKYSEHLWYEGRFPADFLWGLFVTH